VKKTVDDVIAPALWSFSQPPSNSWGGKEKGEKEKEKGKERDVVGVTRLSRYSRSLSSRLRCSSESNRRGGGGRGEELRSPPQ